jgi:hypothetical protein
MSHPDSSNSKPPDAGAGPDGGLGGCGHGTGRSTGSRGWLECRSCPVICERVVHPVNCLRNDCAYVYAYVEGPHTYFGCLRKVFIAELDLAPYRHSPRADAYGALKTHGEPWPECQAGIERAYGAKYSRRECCNPTFRHAPWTFSAEAVRRLVHGLSAASGGEDPFLSS